MSLNPPTGAVAEPDDPTAALLAADRVRARRRLLLLAVLALVIGLVAANRQALSDWWTSVTSSPTESALALAAQIGLTEEGERIFLMARPEVLGQTAFNQACSVDEDAPDHFTSGCYSAAGRIWILEANSDYPQSWVAVTAAHEMLHAAWYRFDAAERDRITALIREAVASLPEDHWLLERMTAYSEDAPEKEYEELFAVIGTEVSEHVGEELETVYRRYLVDRGALIERSLWF